MSLPFRTLVSILFLVPTILPSHGQDTARVRLALQTLCSKKMAGRGYLANGHLHAANWIKVFFEKSGLKPLHKSFFQPVIFDQNVFDGKTDLVVNGKTLLVGRHFLPKPTCPSIKKTFSIIILDSTQIQKISQNTQTRFPDEAWVVPKQGSVEKAFKNKYQPGCWITVNQKLTHSLSQTQETSPEIILADSVDIPRNGQIKINLKARMKKGIHSQNVIAFVQGREKADSFLVVTAHYDHLGKLGKTTFFPGANDNASGTAMLLELADWYARNPPKYSLIFIGFTGEEAGLLGSFYFVENPLVPLSKIKFLMNLDLLGFGDQGATVVNATLHSDQFKRLQEINHSKGYLKEIKGRGKAANSDHYPFSERGVPAFFLYSLGGPGHYHDVMDTPKTINLGHFQSSFGLIRDFLDGF